MEKRKGYKCVEFGSALGADLLWLNVAAFSWGFASAWRGKWECLAGSWLS